MPTETIIVPYEYVPESCMGYTELVETSIDLSEDAGEVGDFDQTENLAGKLPVDYLPFG